MRDLGNLIIKYQNVAFDQNTVADHTIFTPATGSRFVCTKVFLYFDAANTIRFERATTNLSGLMGFATGAYLELGDGEIPVFKGDIDEAFILRVDTAAQVSGFFNVYEIDQ